MLFQDIQDCMKENVFDAGECDFVINTISFYDNEKRVKLKATQ